MTPRAELNFAHRLYVHKQERPWQRALVRPGALDKRDGRRTWTQLTFDELHELTDAYARGFTSEAGLLPGDRVIMLVEPSFEFFAISFALFKLGCVPVLIDPGMGLDGFLSCVEQIKPRVCIGIPKAMLLSKVKAAAFASIEQRITVGPSTWFWAGTTLPLCYKPEYEDHPVHPVTEDTEAAILFTSGSTGPAKGVRYTHGMFNTQAQRIAQMYGIQPGQVDVPCFLPFAMFSCTMGMTVVLPDMDFSKPATAEPEKLVEAVLAHGADQLVASPAVLERLGFWCPRKQTHLHSLKRVLTFGAPIRRGLHEDFKHILDEGVEIHTPYGATESLPVASVSSSTILGGTGERTAMGQGTCVGAIAPETEVRIIGITDEAIEAWSEELLVEPGGIGEVCVKGPQVSREYKERPDANKTSKIQDPEGGFWHRMGDIGYFDDQDRLWFCGRKSHRVRCSDGVELYPVRLEGVFNEHPAVRRSAVVGVEGQPILVVELGARDVEGDVETRRRKIRQELLAMAAANPETERIQTLFFHDGFPVDRRHNAKIHRPELAVWAARRLKLKVA
jgi:acyl-CoA synthetase (AMP-forming)/AMP-acid ligase II